MEVSERNTASLLPSDLRLESISAVFFLQASCVRYLSTLLQSKHVDAWYYIF
jgi:hypothetical protein